ncbi:MAG TPA: hypothetical protein PKA91_18105, partial [Leptospiraceae bacterium]|nr:hypothetical protein [Leptospiraceae bacterium]
RNIHSGRSRNRTGSGLRKKKPEQIEKILPGKIKKFQQDVCLLDQFFIKDNKQTVAELIKSFIGKFGENITISRFTRYEAG